MDWDSLEKTQQTLKAKKKAYEHKILSTFAQIREKLDYMERKAITCMLKKFDQTKASMD